MARTDDPFPLIKRLRSMGMPDAIILNRLLLEGWAEADIRHAFEGRTPVAVSTAAAPTIAPMAVISPPLPPPSIAVPSRLPAPYTPPPLPVERKRFMTSLSPLALGVVLVATGLAATAAVLFVRPPVVYSISIPSAQTAATAELSSLSYGALPALADPAYYAQVKQTLIAQKADFIDANLSSMQLAVFVGGEQKLTVPIGAKGKVGSWWETPAGIYQIQTKEKTHFSTIGQVQMPYSLDFQGNFFIHGWPTYPDGTPVSSSYSGGCIRLATDDAKKVYDLASVGEPVVVYNETATTTEAFNYTLKAPPTLSAAEYLVADLDTGTVLTQKEAQTQAPIASITKLVTALVATEYINLDKFVSVPESALVYSAVPRLKAGTHFKAYDLLFLLLQESSNEAAETLAADRGRAQFVSYMNEKAAAIGLTQTSFSDPSGAADDLSSPADLFKLLRYINDNRRFVFDITAGAVTDSAYGKSSFGNLNDFNLIKNLPQQNASRVTLVGGKVGETNLAGETYAGVFNVAVGTANRKLAVIVLGSKDSPGDVAKLLSFVHDSYTAVDRSLLQ